MPKGEGNWLLFVFLVDSIKKCLHKCACLFLFPSFSVQFLL